VEPRVEPLEAGRALLLVRRLRQRAGDRIVLATGGLTALMQTAPDIVRRALRAPDPQRAVERVVQRHRAEEQAVDLALAVLDVPAAALAPHAAPPGRLVDGARVEAGGLLADHGGALRIRDSALRRWRDAWDDARRRLPPPSASPKAWLQALGRFVAAQSGRQPTPPATDPPAPRNVDDVLVEAQPSPFARAVLAAWLAAPEVGLDALRLGFRWDARLGPVPIAGLTARGASVWFEATAQGTRVEVVLGRPGPEVWPWSRPTYVAPEREPEPAAPDARPKGLAPQPAPPVDPRRSPPPPSRQPDSATARPAQAAPPSPAPPPLARPAPTPDAPATPVDEEGWLNLDDLGS
jgi:hypothetical protein